MDPAEHTEDPLVADVIVVGAGPIGLELAAALDEVGLDYRLIEAQQIGHTISRWPRHTHFYSTAERIAIAGVPIPLVDQEHITGETYLAYLRAVVEQFDLRVNPYERVTQLERSPDGFRLRTETRTGEPGYRSRYVVLATGDMHAPNELGIPGEHLPHVSHHLDDPHRYFRQRLLVVGGGNSALEFAARCWRAGAEVSLSYRRRGFNVTFTKTRLVEDMRTLTRERRITFLPRTVPVEIGPEFVTLAPTRDGRPVEGERIRHPADFVLVCTGYRADLSLFEQAGVAFTGAPGRVPEFNPDTMELILRDGEGSSRLFVAGTAASGQQARHRLFIETAHHHVTKIVARLRTLEGIPGEAPTRVNRLVPTGVEDLSH